MQNPEDDIILGVEQSLKGRRWRYRAADARMAEAIAQAHALPEILGRVLAARGQSVESVPRFLSPQLKSDLPDPSIIRDMDKAVARLVAAIEGGESIAVFGDYDVDGATSSAILKDYLTDIGLEPTIYIPDRMREGYGPNSDALTSLHNAGVRLVITVDCGTLSFEPLEVAAQLGLDVIVVDHHKAEPSLPKAIAVINPNRIDDESDLGQLAAVGVAFLLIVGLNRALRDNGFFATKQEPDLMKLMDVVALGTVCDVVPLTGLNRAFVVQGLKVLAKRERVGLRALADVAGIKERPTAYHLGYMLGPRVNAGGRVGEAPLGSELLSTKDEMRARDIAVKLDHYNAERRAIEFAVQEDAIERVEAMIGPSGDVPPVIVVAGQGWHPGVIGIVASRLKDKYDRPTFVLSVDGVEAKGSARSISGVDIGTAVIEANHKGLLLAGGGHAMAAGLTIESSKIDPLTTFLNEKLADQVLVLEGKKDFKADGVLSVGGATATLLNLVDRAGPFGAGNPTPRFIIENATVVQATVVGDDHVKLTLTDPSGVRLKGIAFRQKDEALGQALLSGVGQKFHLAGQLKHDTWGGGDNVELIVDDAAKISV